MLLWNILIFVFFFFLVKKIKAKNLLLTVYFSQHWYCDWWHLTRSPLERIKFNSLNGTFTGKSSTPYNVLLKQLENELEYLYEHKSRYTQPFFVRLTMWLFKVEGKGWVSLEKKHSANGHGTKKENVPWSFQCYILYTKTLGKIRWKYLIGS